MVLLAVCFGALLAHGRQDRLGLDTSLYRSEPDSGIVLGSVCLPLIFAAKIISITKISQEETGGKSDLENNLNLFWLSCLCSLICIIHLLAHGKTFFPLKANFIITITTLISHLLLIYGFIFHISNFKQEGNGGTNSNVSNIPFPAILASLCLCLGLVSVSERVLLTGLRG